MSATWPGSVPFLVLLSGTHSAWSSPVSFLVLFPGTCIYGVISDNLLEYIFSFLFDISIRIIRIVQLLTFIYYVMHIIFPWLKSCNAYFIYPRYSKLLVQLFFPINFHVWHLFRANATSSTRRHKSYFFVNACIVIFIFIRTHWILVSYSINSSQQPQSTH